MGDLFVSYIIVLFDVNTRTLARSCLVVTTC